VQFSRGSIVCLIGLDGSGKSTCARVIEDWLKSHGKKCVRVWGAHDSLFLRPIVYLAKRLFIGRHVNPYLDYDEYFSTLNKLAQSPIGKYYNFALFAEYCIEIFVKVCIPLMAGYMVVCDRYVFDTTLRIAVNQGMSVRDHLKLLKKWLRLFPKPDLTIWVDVPSEIAMSRKTDIPSTSYLELRRPYYENISNNFSVAHVDGTMPSKKMKQYVIRLLQSIIDV